MHWHQCETEAFSAYTTIISGILTLKLNYSVGMWIT